jgi:hypothetical protein
MRRMFNQLIDGSNGSGMDITNATEAILTRIAQTDNNLEVLETLAVD